MRCANCTPDRWCGCAQTVGEIEALDRQIAELEEMLA